MPRSAARTARRRLPASASSRTRRQPSFDRELVRTWLPPATAAGAFLLFYVLGHLDVIETPPALAVDAFLLTLIALYFPMRYAHRLDSPGRLAAAALAVVWIAAVYLPIHRRIYPAQRIATVEAVPDALPVTLPAAGAGGTIDLVIEGHLEPGVPGSTRAARYRLTIEDSEGKPQILAGEFVESWERQARERRKAIGVLRARTAQRVVLANPTNEDFSVTALEMRGRAERRLTLTLHPHAQLPLWAFLPVCAALLFAAQRFDRATGARETAASLTIATAAALTTTLAFQSMASPHPTFRELLGATIVGALLGGPLGGLAAWWSKTGRRSLAPGHRAP